MLHFFAPKLSNKSVHSETDNYTAPLIVASGSNKAHLQILADDIYVLIIKDSVVLQVKWLPWHKNQNADALSKTATSMTGRLLTPYSTTWTVYGVFLL